MINILILLLILVMGTQFGVASAVWIGIILLVVGIYNVIASFGLK